MAINLNTCTGCNACVIGLPGGEQHPGRGQGPGGARAARCTGSTSTATTTATSTTPTVYHQPRLCMHCENAPCELVCPVAATVHDAEGLNEMVYNRCVGTRYCGNNCPYKVRHFNFFQYADQPTPSLKLLNNPDVTVRARGVMEKCTYCIQRINEARYAAEIEGRPIRDGEVVTACQAACPTRAIVFGDLNDKASQVAQAQGRPAELRDARRAEHAAADDLPGQAAEPQPRTRGEASHDGV